MNKDIVYPLLFMLLGALLFVQARFIPSRIGEYLGLAGPIIGIAVFIVSLVYLIQYIKNPYESKNEKPGTRTLLKSASLAIIFFVMGFIVFVAYLIYLLKDFKLPAGF